MATEGLEMEICGAVLSTMTEPLGPALPARLPARSIAVPPLTDRLSVPSPLMLEIVAVRTLPVPESATVPLAVPVVLRIMFVRVN